MQNSKNKQKSAAKRQREKILLPLLLVLTAIAVLVTGLNVRQQRKETRAENGSDLQEINSGGPDINPAGQALPVTAGSTVATPTPTPSPTPSPTPEPVYVYTIPENSLRGMEPDPEGYHESASAEELAAFLQRDDVKKLIGERQLVWNEEIVLFPESTLRWYFDETILCIVWQEVEARTVGTFSEIIIQDGSQLRRKISSDELWSFAFETTSQFAADTDAVLAFGGDFYYHGRACGIGIYQREFYRFDPVTCDTCYITADGDMLFSYRRQFAEQAEAERFAEENNVLFSLGFGPVLIDDGQDVTPEEYPWGEVNDTYARAAIGLLEEHHYLTMNLNCDAPGTEYYNLATLRQAADAMVARGCRKAYALDGGQTATTVFGGQLINPVQFGWEKEISDIIYFASARGGEKKELP